MTLIDLENYEQALDELAEALAAEEYDHVRIERLTKIIKQYEEMIYKE